MNTNVLLKFASHLSDELEVVRTVLQKSEASATDEPLKLMNVNPARFCHENFNEFGRLSTSNKNITKCNSNLDGFIIPVCKALFKDWYKYDEDTRNTFARRSSGIDFDEMLRRDIILIVSSAEWLYNKQVFEFSDDLLLSLTSNVNSEPIIEQTPETEYFPSFEVKCLSMKLFIDRINFLPFRTFVLDVSENTMFKGSGICAVQVTPLYYPENCKIVIHTKVILNDGSISGSYVYIVDYTYHKDLVLEDNGAKYVSVGVTYSETVQNLLTGKISAIRFNRKDGEGDPYNSVIGAVVCQVINYLGSDGADIEESPATKNTYKPTSTSRIRNTYKEIQKWDCGFKYADSIKKYKSAYESAHTEGTGSPKKPHVRRAHWHHFWAGSGDERHLIRKWITAINVNMEFHSDLILTIRREN